MIHRLFIYWRERQARKRLREIETQTRASTKLTPRYERRRVREIARAQAMFPNTTAALKGREAKGGAR